MPRALIILLLAAGAIVGAQRWKRAHRPHLPRASAHIVLYSVKGCAACSTMRGWLNRRHLPFEDRDAQEIGNRELVVLSRRSAIHEFPLLEVNDHFFGIRQEGEANEALDQFE